MKATILSLMKIYNIKKVLVNDKENEVDFIIANRGRSLSMNDWLNLNIALTKTYKKRINYLSIKDAESIYQDKLENLMEVVL